MSTMFAFAFILLLFAVILLLFALILLVCAVALHGSAIPGSDTRLIDPVGSAHGATADAARG